MFVVAAAIHLAPSLESFQWKLQISGRTRRSFSMVMVISLLALGLYSARQRARVGGIAARVVVALFAGVVVISSCGSSFLVFPWTVW